MQTLPPFRLGPYFRTRVWGFQDLAPWFDYKTDGEPIGEVWLTGEECRAETGPLAAQSLKQISAEQGERLLGSRYGDGKEFPLLVKMLFPKEKLSVQVHPDDAMAWRYGAPRGKTECWYALDAEPGAAVALGLKPGSTAKEIRTAIDNATLEDLMLWVPVHRGDMIFVDAGTIHAIGPGAVILETQQTSDLTYRMYDYGRGRELHLEKSLEAMRLTTAAGIVPPVQQGERTELIDAEYFRVDRLLLDGAGAGRVLGAPRDWLQVLFVAEGEITISGNDFDSFVVKKCQVAVVPAAAPHWTIASRSGSEIIQIMPK